MTEHRRSLPRWLNRTVLSVGLASLFSDWSHEIATTPLPVFSPNPRAIGASPDCILRSLA
jgi:hypothetical protein